MGIVSSWMVGRVRDGLKALSLIRSLCFYAPRMVCWYLRNMKLGMFKRKFDNVSPRHYSCQILEVCYGHGIIK